MSAYGNAAVAQSVERRLGKAEVTGSIPVSSFIFLLIFKGFRDFGDIKSNQKSNQNICSKK